MGVNIVRVKPTPKQLPPHEVVYNIDPNKGGNGSEGPHSSAAFRVRPYSGWDGSYVLETRKRKSEGVEYEDGKLVSYLRITREELLELGNALVTLAKDGV